MTYPRVMSERDTLAAALAGKSLARYGDGELKLCIGGRSISQQHDAKLQRELCDLLRQPPADLLPCIPNIISATPRGPFWREFRAPQYTALYSGDVRYGSSFITRPDNAPWIDRPDYWAEVRRLWAGRSVAYVGGQDVLLNHVKQDASRVDVLTCAKRDAYGEIDDLTRRLLSRRYDVVIIAAGAAGTALAGRLAGAQHALDLGHIGMFMTNPGAFSFNPDELATPEYRKLLRHAHATTNWGRGGANWAEPVAALARNLECADVLDYGCGGGMLKPALAKLGVKCLEYDPGVPGKDVPPKIADLVVSTDVFEHIETPLVPNVLKHTFALARKGAFFVIAKQPTKKILADGRNAHLTCQPTEWWIERLVEAGWQRDRIKVKEDAWKKCVLVLTK